MAHPSRRDDGRPYLTGRRSSRRSRRSPLAASTPPWLATGSYLSARDVALNFTCSIYARRDPVTRCGGLPGSTGMDKSQDQNTGDGPKDGEQDVQAMGCHRSTSLICGQCLPTLLPDLPSSHRDFAVE